MNQPSLERMVRTVQSDIDAGRLPGAVIVVCKNGTTFLSKALGKRDPQASDPLCVDSIFRIYSMTKPIASVGLMQLVEEGKVQIADPVAKYLPEFEGLTLGVAGRDDVGQPVLERIPLSQLAATRAPTVQDLLRHTSGLTYGIFGESQVKATYRKAEIEQGKLTNTEFSQRLATLPLAYAPGTVWEYGRSTDIVGALIERVSGQTLGVYLQERIFGPLGMHDTGFALPAVKQARVAQPFAIDPDSATLAVRLLDTNKVPVYESAGGGLLSTAPDYLRFSSMLLAGGTLDGVRILSSKTIALMTSDHLGADIIRASRAPGANTEYLPGPGYGFGLGFAVRVSDGEAVNAGSVGDYAWGGLAGTYFWNDPKENLTAIWMMQGPYQREYYRNLFKNMVYAAL
jgi:CubicO group peptidase (beta-lactamase class C family)